MTDVAPVTKLIRQGGRLAVLGCLEPTPEHPNAYRWWHVVQPGSYTIPQVGDKVTYGTSLCGRFVVTNGYAADWRPAEGQLCPKCSERL
jgi:hypothetical protein